MDSRAHSYPCPQLPSKFQLTPTYWHKNLSYEHASTIEVFRYDPISSTMRVACSLCSVRLRDYFHKIPMNLCLQITITSLTIIERFQNSTIRRSQILHISSISELRMVTLDSKDEKACCEIMTRERPTQVDTRLHYVTEANVI